MNTTNPYEAPRAAVDDPVVLQDEGNFLGEGRAVSAGNGWQWIVGAWGLFKANPLVWFALVALFFGASLALNFVPFIGGLVSNMLFPFVIATVGFLGEGIRRGRGADFGAALNQLALPAPRLAILGLIYLALLLALVFAAFLPILGMGGLKFFTGQGDGGLPKGLWLVFVIEFVVGVPIMMAFYFAPYLTALHGLAPIEALRRSFFACLRNILPGLVMLLATVGLAILATLPIMLGWFVLMPVMMIVSYAAYRDVFFEA